jgi:soluble lytic murein transglycosylase
MEKMTNIEAREYGKRVLTNYVIYMNKLGKPTRLLPYIEQLTIPSKTDRFRK